MIALVGVARIEISPRARALLFLFAVVCASLLMAAETSLVGTITSFETPEVGRRLLAFDADDPRLEDQLGQAYKDVDPAQSLRHLRRATQLSPGSRLYWSDLESVCESVGDTQCADHARERLLQLCPMAPSYHWLVADSCLRTNRLDMAFQQFRRLLELDPSYAAPTWSTLQTVKQPLLVFQKVLADNPDARLKVGYVDFLSDQGDNDIAYQVWRLVETQPVSFPFSSAAPYLDRLIALGRIEQALSVWHDLERVGIIKLVPTASSAHAPSFTPAPAPEFSPALAASSLRLGQAVEGDATPTQTKGVANEQGNLVFNGDFEQAPLNAGFDWRTGPTTYLAIDFSAPGAYRGGRCLRVDFTVSRNDEFEPVYQIVPVFPRHAYRLEAFIRSQDITSDTGPCLRVSDTHPGGFPDVVSETTVGTTPWHPVHLVFSTGPQTQAIRVSFWRPRSRVFPTEISGTSWLDAVSLHERSRE